MPCRPLFALIAGHPHLDCDRHRNLSRVRRI